MTKRLSWEQFSQDAIPSSKKGIFFLTKEIAKVFNKKIIEFCNEE
jgi:hypothetical protein